MLLQGLTPAAKMAPFACACQRQPQGCNVQSFKSRPRKNWTMISLAHPQSRAWQGILAPLTLTLRRYSDCTRAKPGSRRSLETRYEDQPFEKLLADNGTLILNSFALSKQSKRNACWLVKRTRIKPETLGLRLEESRLLDAYQVAYEDMLNKCSKPGLPGMSCQQPQVVPQPGHRAHAG